MTLQEYNDLYKQPLLKSMTITTSGGITITNANIVSETMSLEKSLCSETNLRYGRCEAACFKIRIADLNHDFTGEWLNVVQDVMTDSEGYLLTQNGLYLLTEDGYKIKLKDEEIDEARAVYGCFRVHSDKPSNDRRWRDLTCYDVMYDILNADVISWYNGLTFPMTLKNLRDSFFTYLGITQETTTLINDSFVTPGGFSVSGSLSGKIVIESICELNGVFGQITGDGKFQYVSLSSPPTLTLDYYVDGTGSYEDYVTDAVTGINAKGTTNDVGTIVGTDTNLYIIANNPLVYGTEGTTALTTALNTLLRHITAIQFRPFKVTTYGNPMLPLGTQITLNTKNQIIISYVVSKELNGIQSLKDTISATSEKHQPTAVNSPVTEIKRSQGKIHELEINVDGLTSRVSATETNLSNNYSTTNQMNSAINQKASEITQTVSTTYETKSDATSKFNTANTNAQGYANDALSVANTNAQGYANTALTTARSEISQLSNKVAVKVNSSGRLVTAELGVDPASSTSYVKVKADDLDIIANGNLQLTAKTLGIDSTYFKVSSTGVITATSGTIGGFTISETAIQAETGGSTHGLVIQALKTTNYDAIAYAIRVRNSSSDAWTYPFIVRWNGHTTMTNANVTGTIRATAGAVGGWKIQSWGLYDDKADTAGNLGAGLTKYGSGPAFWAGSDLSNINTAPFRVLHDGTLCAGNLLATGGTIASWNINRNNLAQVYTAGLGARIGFSGDSSDPWVLAVGNPANKYYGAEFRVDILGRTIAKGFVASTQSGRATDLNSSRIEIDHYGIEGYDSSNTRQFVIGAEVSYMSLEGNLYVHGSKNRVAETRDYGERLLYCYETPTPMFGDVGEGKIAEDGKCYVWLDSAFSETIKTDSYQVFLQKYGQGECYVAERTKRYFVVKGDAGQNFAWELKARQAGFENNRLETFNEELDAFYKTTDYGEKAISHLGLIKDEREVA